MRNIKIFRPCRTLCLLLLASLSLHANEWHVNASASTSSSDGSPQNPFPSIGLALRKATHGDVITVADGIYRESIVLYNKNGVQKLTIKAAEGQRPILSGRRLISNWERHKDGFYHATLHFRPINLFINGNFMPMARYPEDGWLTVTNKGKNHLMVPLETRIPVGSKCYVWLANGNIFGTADVTESDKPGTFIIPPKRMRLSTQTNRPDRCFFLGHQDFIRKNGQWLWKQTGKKSYEVIVRLDTPPNHLLIEAGGAGTPLTINRCSNITVSGFNVTGGCGDGVRVAGSDSIVLDKLGLFWNNSACYLRGSRKVTLQDSRISCNQKAVVLIEMAESNVLKCDVGYNYEDGIVVSWRSKDINLEGNRIHHHSWWGHPDNVQFYRDVKNVTMKDNLLFSSCQGIMAQELNGCHLENNACLGTSAYMFIWGWASSNDIVLKHNTMLFSCYGALSISGKDYDVTNNVIMDINFSRDPVKNRHYRAANNLHMPAGPYWQVFCDKKWIRNLEDFCTLTGETDSAFRRLPQPGLPSGVASINEMTISECTRDTLLMRGHCKFQVGDVIEINFDGVPRTVTKVSKGAVTFTPQLLAKPLCGYVVLNWKDNKELIWSSPFESQYGSSLNLDNVRKDRITSVPMPKQVQAFIDHIDFLIPPQGY